MRKTKGKHCNHCGKRLNGCAVYEMQAAYYCVNLDCPKYALYQFPFEEMKELSKKMYKSVDYKEEEGK